MKSKPDIFLDLSLAIKADGELKPYKSLEESMSSFVKLELLNGNNKYRCENCNSLEDAEKGLAIKEFPSILAIQLKRYDFDYNTLHRIKLNDRLTFPDYLDLNKYLYKEPTPKLSYAQAVSKPSTSSKDNSPESSPAGDKNTEKGWLSSLNWPNIPYLNTEDDSGWLNVNVDHESVQGLLKNGPHIYQLFSVLIHQGSATGGHYFAYIKNLDQQKWFCFNDSSVTHATLEEVKKTFGGNQHLGFNSSNAYMLMYRRIEPANESFIRTPELPEHVKNLLVQIEKEEAEIAVQRQLERESVNVHVICNDESTIYDGAIDFIMHKDITYQELRHQLCSTYPSVNEADVRLIKSNHNWEILSEYFADSPDPPLNEIHRLTTFRPEAHIMLDTKQGTHFYEIPPPGSCKTADVHLVDLDNSHVVPAKRVCFDYNMCVADLKGHLCVIPQVRISNPLHLRVVFDAYQDRNQPMVLWDEGQVEICKLARMIRGENLQLFIDIGSADLLEKDRSVEKYENSLMFEILERKKYSMRLIVWFPTLEDFNDVNLPAPDFQNLTAPIKTTCGRVEEETKELSADETDSSSSNGYVDRIADDCFVDSTINGGSSDYVPPDPFQKCSVEKLNIDATNAEINAGCSLSASSTYSSTNSNAPTNFTSNENEPLDPEQMEVLIKTSSSVSEPNSGPPPPPYSEKIDQLSNTQATSDTQSTGTKSVSIQSPRDEAHSSTEINDEDAVSLCSNTPKRSPTPNVSDNEDSNDLLPKNLEKRISIEKNTAAFVNNLQPANATDEPEINMDLFSEDKHTPSIVASDLPDANQVEIVSRSLDADHMRLELNLDRRLSLAALHTWLAAYLKLNRENVQIYKFYNEFGDGFAINFYTLDTVQNSLSEVNHICIKLIPTSDEKLGRTTNYIQGKDRQSGSTSLRRERQLRIKLASESEP
ncbi:Ubiquitin carboxyl-terminal hydrolase [Aphelenchoides bicaudatus]|nr:Ubiquitin carboxyl-terminal hydrolase [Aphelenchoides bicaudatus]